MESKGGRAGVIPVPPDVDLNEFLLTYSEGFPIVAPTEGRVKAMLSGTRRDPLEVIGRCPPNLGVVTVEKAAINAVMAGCAPMHFRVVLAAVEAMLHEDFNLHGAHATTMGASPCVLVNGPARAQAQINCEHGALGSGHRANACIGRALKLILLNVGGGRLALTESTTIGSPSKYTLCFGEYEEHAARWDPYHVGRGFAREDSVVTVMSVVGGPTQLVDFYTRDAEELLRLLAGSMHGTYNTYFPLINNCLVVLSPEHHDTLVRGGYTSKAQVARALWQYCNKDMAPEIRRICERQLPWGVGSVVGYTLGLVARGVNLITGAGLPFLPKFSSPDSFHIVVAGAPAGKFSAFLPGFGIGKPPMPTANLSVPVSKKVEAPIAASALLPFPPSSDQRVLHILNPCSELAAAALTRTPRVGTIVGTVGLLDISKQGGAVLLDRIEALLCNAFPSITVKRFVKATFSRPMAKSLADEITGSCQFVISALAD